MARNRADAKRHESEIAVAAEKLISECPEIGYVSRDYCGWRSRCPVVVDVVSAAFDIDNIGLGSSPYTGDMSRTGIAVPIASTVDQQHRYLFRLVTMQVPSGAGAVILGVHTAQTLRTVLEGVGADSQTCFRPLEILVREPFWQPPNGNISWHLRQYQLREHRRLMTAGPSIAGNDIYVDGDDTALLHASTVSFAPYTPPFSGIPPGRAVGTLGTWRDNRDWQVYIPVFGPRKIALYASVHQFDSMGICPVAAPADLGAISQEDRFLYAFGSTGTGAHYGRVAGALSVELWPNCNDLHDHLLSSGKLFQPSSPRRLQP
jgi:hypothetical protein